MSGVLRAWLRATLLLVCALVAPTMAFAHEMTMAEMELRETARGDFIWQWASSNDKLRDISEDLHPQWPAGCTVDTNSATCGQKGLTGMFEIEGVGETYSAVIMRIVWLDGQERVYTLTKSQPSVQLYGTSEDKRNRGEIASAYLVLGVEHILGGIDHLLFVFSLLFLVGFQRKLVWTITAFTAAHSLTLASAALGWLVLRPRRWKRPSPSPSCWSQRKRFTSVRRWHVAIPQCWRSCSVSCMALDSPVR